MKQGTENRHVLLICFRWRFDSMDNLFPEYFGSFIPLEDLRVTALDEKQIQTIARLETIEEKALAYALYLAGY